MGPTALPPLVFSSLSLVTGFPQVARFPLLWPFSRMGVRHAAHRPAATDGLRALASPCFLLCQPRSPHGVRWEGRVLPSGLTALLAPNGYSCKFQGAQVECILMTLNTKILSCRWSMRTAWGSVRQHGAPSLSVGLCPSVWGASLGCSWGPSWLWNSHHGLHGSLSSPCLWSGLKPLRACGFRPRQTLPRTFLDFKYSGTFLDSQPGL